MPRMVLLIGSLRNSSSAGILVDIGQLDFQWTNETKRYKKKCGNLDSHLTSRHS
jgi:hypothetical protein